MEIAKLDHVLSLTTCSEILGMTRSGTYKKLQKAGFSMEKNEQQEIEINSSVFAGKYPKETTAYLKRISGHMSENDNGNNGKQQELQVKDQIIETLKALNNEKDQRLEDEKAGRAREVALLETQVRLLADQSGRVPQEVVEKIARLEVELAIAKEQAAAVSADELAELKRKAKAADDQQAFNEMRDKIMADYNSLPYLKRIMKPKPTIQDVRNALKQSRGGEGADVQPKDAQPAPQEKTA